MSIVLQFFPNGEFSQGVDTSKKRRDKRRHETTQTYPLSEERRHEYLQWIEEYKQGGYPPFDKIPIGTELITDDRLYTLEERGHDNTVLSFRDTKGRKYCISLYKRLDRVMFEWKLVPLVYQSVESCEISETPILPSIEKNDRTNRKKLEGMTKNMSRNIRNGVYLLEQQPGGKDCLSFLTLTLPNLSTDGLKKCCASWDYMVKRFLDWLRIRIENQDMNFMYVYAVEIQSKRLEKRHEYAPHLHLVFRGRNGKKTPWIITPREARKAWDACITSVVDEHFNGNALENLQRIRKSAARYLSKYLSKGKCAIPEGAESDTIQSLRTQWGGMARQVSRAIKSNTVRIAGCATQSRMVYAFIEGLPILFKLGYVCYFKNGFIPLYTCSVTGHEYGLHVCSGALSTPTYQGGLNPVFEFLSNRIGSLEA